MIQEKYLEIECKLLVIWLIIVIFMCVWQDRICSSSMVNLVLCNQCLSPLMLWVRISIRARCTTLCDKFVSDFSSTNKTDSYDIYWNIVESGVEHLQTNKLYAIMIKVCNCMIYKRKVRSKCKQYMCQATTHVLLLALNVAYKTKGNYCYSYH